MKKTYNWKKSNFEDYYYSPNENQNKYYNHYFNPKTAKTNNFYSNKHQNFKNFKKNDFFGSETENTPKFEENGKFQSFYPKNYKKPQKQFINKYNNNDESYEFSSKKNNDFSNYENFLNNNNNFGKNESLTKNENIQKNQNDEEANKCENEIIVKNEQYEKRKKIGIKSIPHPKRKKGHGSCYISGKKLLPYQQKKDDNIIIKKERKLSNSSLQNNFDSAKHSISTLNTSSSSYKDKDVSNDDKKICVSNDIKYNEINNNDIDNENKTLINKFDEKNTEIKHYETNPIFENTPILQVNVKLPDNRTVIFQLRRYDDLFFTIKLFCEINSIEEKFIKPIIIKSLCTINTIYQIYNSPVSLEDISVLKKVKKISDNC